KTFSYGIPGFFTIKSIFSKTDNGWEPTITSAPFARNSTTTGSVSSVLKSFTIVWMPFFNNRFAVAVLLLANPKTSTFSYGNGVNVRLIKPPREILQYLQIQSLLPRMSLQLSIQTSQSTQNGDGSDSF